MIRIILNNLENFSENKKGDLEIRTTYFVINMFFINQIISRHKISNF